MSIEKLIQKFQLTKHPEGGFFKELYRSEGVIPGSVLGKEFSGDRNFATSIYFLLTSENFSAFHRIRQDEIWNFYSGSNIFIHSIDPIGNYQKIELGMKGDAVPQYVIPRGCWFASSVKELNSYGFAGCTVAPGFDFKDFELANRNELCAEFPQHRDIISRLTRS